MTAAAVLVWLVNLGISAWNAYATGLAWVEAKHSGGWPRAMAWAGGVMSALGFSWCYLMLFAAVAQGLEWLDHDDIVLALKLGYVLLIPGILVSGLMITLDSWGRAYRTRRITDMGLAAWNSYAQIHNTFHAIGNLDKAFGAVINSLSGGWSSGSSSSSGKSKDGAGLVAFLLVFVLVLAALFSGVLTTAVIVSRVAGNDDMPGGPKE